MTATTDADGDRAIPGASLRADIEDQPAALARLIAGGRADTEAVAREVLRYAPRWILIAARGSSDNAARYAQYLFGAHNRLAVALAAPSLFTVYQRPPELAGALVLGVSQSGESPDVVGVLDEARRQGALTVAITHAPSSPLARAAALVLPLHAGVERAVAASKTYTAELMALAMLSAAMAGDEARWAELDEVPDRVAAALAVARAGLAEPVERCRDAPRLVVLGRGFNYATAFEIALKIVETSYAAAQPYSTADFLHGPAAALDAGLPVVHVAPRGAPSDASRLLDLLDARGAFTIGISDDPSVLDRVGAPLPIPSGPEWLSPIVAVVPGQRFALELALARGHDPDRPRGLSKITRTR